MAKKRCAILGCTGSVGQRFILLLADHPSFEIVAIAASARSAGQRYKDVVKWKQAKPMGQAIGNLVVKECTPEALADDHLDIIFSGLDASVAGDIESALFKVDRYAIFSNAKNHRMVVGYPLIIPTANIHHLSLIDSQRHTSRLSKSLLVCNTNCALVGVAVPLFALQKALGPVSDVSVVTMQAISGAGYPGVPSMDILDNVVPFISGEEEKIEQEARKVLAEKPVKFDGLEEGEKVSHYEESKIRISSQCNRVPVLDGHTACISLRFANREKIPSAASCRTAMAEYVSAVQDLGCASAPPQAIVVMDEDDRPQPRLDRDVGNGQSVCVGRVRGDPSGIWDILFVSLAHNTVIGAAGASILNAEAAVKQGYIT